MQDQDDATLSNDGQALPLPNDLLPPADQRPSSPTPGQPPGVGTYRDPERLGLMLLAVRDGVTATADAHNVPRRTLAHWLDDFGGVERVQAWLEAETAGRFLRFEQSVYDWAIRQLEGDSIDNEHAWITARKLIEARALVPAQQAAAQPPALAAAQATVTLKVEEADGKVTVLDLGAPPEASDQG